MSNQVEAIKIENISKVYRIGMKENINDNLTGSLLNLVKSPFKNFKRYRSLYRFDDVEMDMGLDAGSTPPDIIWALRNISFNVKQGEVVGIIGSNGAGKSTLLKILCRITSPTKGSAEIYGRVASLLEVGTGFHQELTGRENVFLNGAILGMTKKEMNRRYDEIVDFSGIEKFVDTPVKRYSSGMRVRLAFSVAAHLNPEVLIIDEVLAVGDDQFQKKCLNKMEDAAQQGRTVIFVSHNMPAVLRLCKRAILMDQGMVTFDSTADETVAEYLAKKRGAESLTERVWTDKGRDSGSGIVRLQAVRVYDEDGRVDDPFEICKAMMLEVEYDVLEPGKIISTHFHLDNAQRLRVFSVHDTDPQWLDKPRKVGHYRSRAQIPANFLMDGLLSLHVAILTMNPIMTEQWEFDALSFNMRDSFKKGAARGNWPNEMNGVVRPLLEWTNEFSST